MGVFSTNEARSSVYKMFYERWGLRTYEVGMIDFCFFITLRISTKFEHNMQLTLTHYSTKFQTSSQLHSGIES